MKYLPKRPRGPLCSHNRGGVISLQCKKKISLRQSAIFSLWLNRFLYQSFCWSQRGGWGRDPFNQNSDRSDREKLPTSKGGPVFSKLFRLDLTDIHWVLVELNGLRPKIPRMIRSCWWPWVSAAPTSAAPTPFPAQPDERQQIRPELIHRYFFRP